MENKEEKSFLDRLVHEKGKRYHGTLLPDDILPGEVGDCFDHCFLQALYSDGKYFYCEGKACVNGKWFHHAWLTDEKRSLVYDPTWKGATFLVHYIGVVLDLEAVTEFLIKTEYKSPLANHDKNPELAQKIYDTAI